MKKTFLLLFTLACFASVKAQVISIADARNMPLGTTVTIRGIITNGSELGTIRYLQDGTAGIGLYSTSLSGLKRGDSVEVTGVLYSFNNLLELSPVTSYTVISTGNPLPAPKVLTMVQGYTEQYEGQLVRFNNSQFISTGTFSLASANYQATDNTVAAAEVRVVGTTNIAGTPIPSGKLSLIGIMSQYQSSYQLLPRDLDDLVLAGNPPVLLSAPFQHNIQTTSFDIYFQTQNPGNTIVYYGLTPALGNVVFDNALVTEHNITVSGLTPTTLYYVKVASVSATGDTSYSAVIPMMTRSLSSGKILAYFTRNVDHSVAQGSLAVTLPQQMDDTLIAYMNRAKYTMDIAIYNMDNNNGIVDAINAAYNRGVTVRIIGDANNMNMGAWNQLLLPAPNMKLSPTGSSYGIMHNKFVIIDAYSPDPNDAIVWTGSMNFTNEQINNDANNVIIIQDQSLAQAYTMEFEEMFAGVFGPDKKNNTPKEFNVGGRRVELYFSPSDDTETAIRRTIETADYDLQFCVYAYTRFNISYSIDERTDAGVWGGGVVDDTSNGDYAFDILYQNMANQLFVANHSYAVHHKYLLVDANAPAWDPLVLTGSHNWSSSAQLRNDENTVIVHDAQLANQYYQEWVARYKEAGGSILPNYIGVSELHAPEWIAYPNPLVGAELTLQGIGIGPVEHVYLLDVSGRMKAVPFQIRGSNLIVHTGLLPAGSYLLQVLGPNVPVMVPFIKLN
ncbi:MAG: phospholipase D-like domain-containing protein [Chitinophagales bacterium]|nr:phospholipase D-like domain-containing protein [Chitinophagales bacterium]MDW8427816.1 phospholipase D-like domain-containing protein [Chitinophagales bacterium]